jgi:hypothetical protein
MTIGHHFAEDGYNSSGFGGSLAFCLRLRVLGLCLVVNPLFARSVANIGVWDSVCAYIQLIGMHLSPDQNISFMTSIKLLLNQHVIVCVCVIFPFFCVIMGYVIHVTERKYCT